jgi:hypothetical protein
MKRLILLTCIVVVTFIPVHGWGFFGHKTINHAAVFTLPNEMFQFYKSHISEITEMAINADKRRYAIDDEAPRHYLDADFYEDVVPLDTIPRNFDSAVNRYGLDTVLKHGIVPWHVTRVKWWLTKAFINGDVESIVRLSADLGHYIGDLHVPLHSTHHYNGQMTGQHGIHAFWESRLPELFINDYDLFVGKAEYMHDVSAIVWQRFEESYAAKDSVLKIEKELSRTTKAHKLFSYEQRGKTTVRTQSRYYSNLYHNALNSMVEDRMRSSIIMVGSMWFTAWVDAGQPDLGTLVSVNITEKTSDTLKIDGKIKGRMEPH